MGYCDDRNRSFDLSASFAALVRLLTLREVEPPANFTPAPDTAITLDCPRAVVSLTNTATQPGTGYGG